MKRILLAALLTSGCGAKQLLEKPDDDPSAGPASLRSAETEKSAAPAAEPVAASCTTPECEEACLDAGALASACAGAFAAGCFSDVPPDSEVCEWRSEKKRQSQRMEEESDDDAEKEASEDGAGADPTAGPAVRPHEHSD